LLFYFSRHYFFISLPTIFILFLSLLFSAKCNFILFLSLLFLFYFSPYYLLLKITLLLEFLLFYFSPYYFYFISLLTIYYFWSFCYLLFYFSPHYFFISLPTIFILFLSLLFSAKCNFILFLSVLFYFSPYYFILFLSLLFFG
jgi:hypothetical protein